MGQLADCSNLAEVFECRSRLSEKDVALRCDEEVLSFSELRYLVNSIAGQFSCYQQGQKAILLLDNSTWFAAAFWACQLVGLIPVPISKKSSSQRLQYIIDDCQPALIVCEQEFEILNDSGVNVLTLTDTRHLQVQIQTPKLRSQDIAFIQYTSGSTGQAKGVMISHAAVLANIRSFSQLLPIDDNTVFSSMIPMYHDMGLVCFMLAPFYWGRPLVIYPQQAISLYAWLEGIAKHRVTISGGPNTLMYLANRVVNSPEEYDLSSLQMFICGSEPNQPDVLRRFAGSYNLEGKICPAYGQAELTLCASISTPGENFRVQGQLVSAGKAAPGCQLALLGDDEKIYTGRNACGTGLVGEILVKTPAALSGYLGKPELTSKLWMGDYIRTGDIGYFDSDGFLFICGRRKNMIVRGGKKYSPHDLEALAQQLSFVRRAAVVADKHIFLVLELSRSDLGHFRELIMRLVRLCQESQRQFDYQPDFIHLVSTGTIPVTDNGKLRHQLLLERLINESFESVVLTPLGEVVSTSMRIKGTPKDCVA